MPAPLPWFPFYVDAFETDEVVRSMTDEEVGVFLRLLIWQWREGSVPAQPAHAARTLRSRARTVRVVLKRCFVPDGHGTGRLVNRKLAEVYAEQVGKSEKARERARLSRDRRAACEDGARTVRAANAHGASPSQDRSRSRLRSEIQKSLSAHAETKVNGGDP